MSCSCSYQWSLRLDVASGYPHGVGDFVRSVKYDLHPTFSPGTVTVSEAPFALPSYRGWGTFTVTAHITFHEGYGELSEVRWG